MLTILRELVFLHVLVVQIIMLIILRKAVLQIALMEPLQIVLQESV